MTPEQLERHPTSKRWNNTPTTKPTAVVEVLPSHIFVITNDDGTRSRVMWSEDGRIVPLDEFCDYT